LFGWATAGVPVSPPVGESEGNSDGKGPNASDLTKSDLLLPGWAIALATVGGCLFLCGCGCTVYFVRRKRRMFAYNQMDSGENGHALPLLKDEDSAIFSFHSPSSIGFGTANSTSWF
jgi:hypothetical protein